MGMDGWKPHCGHNSMGTGDEFEDYEYDTDFEPVEDEENREVDFEDKKVTQDDSLFDPNYVDEFGRTNMERMGQGLAAIGYDGQPINIHHIDQTNDGPVKEMTQAEHRQNYKELHENTGQSPSSIDRNEFKKWKRKYWKQRTKDFKRGGCI